jgi:hypothetical protein
MATPEKLLSLLRDPAGFGELQVDGNELVNRATGKRYPVVDGMPVFVEATGSFRTCPLSPRPDAEYHEESRDSGGNPVRTERA